MTRESSAYATDPPTPAWPTVDDQVAVTAFHTPNRSEKDGVIDTAIDLMRWISVPDNLYTIQSEIGTTMPNVKNVPVDPRFGDAFALLTEQIGESQMFVYEVVTMDGESAEQTGQAWRSYMLDQMDLDTALDIIQESFAAYADRFIEVEGLDCS